MLAIAGIVLSLYDSEISRVELKSREITRELPVECQ